MADKNSFHAFRVDLRWFRGPQQRDHQLLFLFLLYALIVEAGTLIYLLAIPADPRNQILFGYSLARLGLMAGLLFLLSVTGALLIGSMRKISWAGRVSGVAFSNLAAALCILGAGLSLLVVVLSFLTITRIFPVFSNRFLMERLQPLLLLGLLLFLGILPFQLLVYRRRPWVDVSRWVSGRAAELARFAARLIQGASLALSPVRMAVLTAAVFLFVFLGLLLRYSFPTGNAGLYSLMSELLLRGHFGLPLNVPFYGPGGIPFAYPPLGFYLMALIEAVLNITPFDYLRIAPPLFAAGALIAIFLVAYDITGSRAGGFVAVVIVATSEYIFHVHLTSGGAVRGLAFLFAVWAVTLYLFAVRRSSWKYAAFSGLLAGLAALTHLGYILFIVLFYAACLLTGFFSRRTWIYLSAAAAAGLVIISPWLALILTRYGLEVFRGAFQSHGNSYFLFLFQESGRIVPWLQATLQNISQAPLLFGLIVLGLIDGLLQKKFWLPVWFGLVVFFTSESDRYLVTVGALLAALIAARLYHSMNQPGQTESSSGGAMLRGELFIAAISLIFIWQFGSVVPRRFQPFFGQNAVALADYVRQSAAADAVYLAVMDDGEAEWLPYLMRRTPSAGTWGSEWLGTYGENLGFMSDMNRCVTADSYECLVDQVAKLAKRPDYLITLTRNSAINQNLGTGSVQPGWTPVYENPRYILWKGAASQ